MVEQLLDLSEMRAATISYKSLPLLFPYAISKRRITTPSPVRLGNISSRY